MLVSANEFLRKGESIEWEQGNLVCIRKSNGKFRLTIKKRGSVLRNKDNKWLYKEEFEYVSQPESYKMIVRFANESRIVDLLKGEYLTDKRFYVDKKVGEKSYLALQTSNNKSVLINL